MSNFNLEMKVADGGVWWDNLKTKDGWKLQKNKLSGHYRIISPDKIRKAWGPDGEEIKEIFRQLTNECNEHESQSIPPNQNSEEKPSSQEILNQLKTLGELYENSVLTEKEFEESKKKLLIQL